MPTSARPAAFMARPLGWGSVAALRSLRAAGIPAVVGFHRFREPGLASRGARWRVRCPSPQRPSSFIPWLEQLGQKRPGLVLLANDDHTAWAFARFAGQLRNRFTLTSPPAEALEALLDKVTLAEAASASGIATARAWPVDEFEGGITRATFPVLVKRRSQVGAHGQDKGAVIEGPAEFAARLARFVRKSSYDSLVAAEWPAVTRPIVQEYLGAGPVASITGFIAPDGRVVASRGARKVFQWPTSAGLGVCFEGAAVDADLLERLRRMCRDVGYFGVFEAEFAFRGDLPVLLDFNPRFYGQMAFDLARGMDLARLLYATATDDRQLLEQTTTEAARPGGDPGLVYCDRPRLEFVLRGPGKAASGRWRAWLTSHRGNIVNPAATWRDPGPGVSAAATNAVALARWRVQRR